MENSYDIVRSLYKNDQGGPFEMTPSQTELFDAIFYGIVNTVQPMSGAHPRVQAETYTQWGKSEIASLAVLTAITTYPARVVLIGPTGAKVKIIMGYVIKHIFDSDSKYIQQKFEIGDESMERIRRERSKNRLTFRVSDPSAKHPLGQVGEVFIVSAEARRKGEDAGNALMGFGAPALIEDESALIPDPIHSKGMRMVGGHKTNFVCKLGNPFKRNHFFKSHNNPSFKRFVFDYQRGITEGRIMPEYIEEMRGELFFDVLYECKFPAAGVIDEHGWLPLLTEEEVQRAMVKGGKHAMFGMRRMGWDIARGGNWSVGVLRSANYGSILHRSKSNDTMGIAGEVIREQAKNQVDWRQVYVDRLGVGAGLFDRIKEQNMWVKGVSGADKPQDDNKFANLRAEMFWRLREWILAGGRLENDPVWMELAKIKYKANSSGKMLIMSKEQMMMDGIDSPDFADALSLTFAESFTPVKQRTIQEEIQMVAERRRAGPTSFR